MPRNAPSTPSTPATPGFEAAIGELEAIVSAMEGDALPLEEALARYQRGMQLLKHCQDTLDQAEQRVRMLEGDVLRDIDPISGASA